MIKNKVPQIEFHLHSRSVEELDDCILRMAKLINEGYKIYSIKNDPYKNSIYTNEDVNIHITMMYNTYR